MGHATPVAPSPYEPDPAADPDPDRAQLWRDVLETLYKLPTYFRSSLDVGGVMATDIFSFNTPLGATIEQQVVENLNLLRDSWDPNRNFDDYSFERQPQNFPDVVLKPNRLRPNRIPILGIELKGWYALAKEGEPSFRYTATPAVSSNYDLLAVFPWVLSNVISGSPVLFSPYVVPAKYAAEFRNYYWEYLRKPKNKAEDKSVVLSSATTHYPIKSETIADRPANNDKDNFGRYARTNAMKEFIGELDQELVAGIPLAAWRDFFKIFTSTTPKLNIVDEIARIANQHRSALGSGMAAQEKVAKLEQVFQELLQIFESP